MKGAKRPTHCASHAPTDGSYQDVRHPRCEHDGCEVIATFAVRGTKRPTRCSTHVPDPDAYYNVMHPRCQRDGCDARAYFGQRGTKRPTHCGDHVPDDGDFVDLVHAYCQHDGCRVIASYGPKGSKRPTHCVEHAPADGTFGDVVNPLCQHDGCGARACFGRAGTKTPTHCGQHVPDDTYTDVLNPRCKRDGCDTLVKRHRNDGYCLRCYVHLFPGSSTARGFKTKERHVVDAVRDMLDRRGHHAHAETLVVDKRVAGGCSGRRPDILIDRLTHSVIVEVDEDGHETYDCTCENKRLMELFVDLGSRPMIVLRFNPDRYVTSTGRAVPSCFSYHASLGVPAVKTKARVEWQRRLSVLETHLLDALDGPPPTMELDVRHLFFDGSI